MAVRVTGRGLPAADGKGRPKGSGTIAIARRRALAAWPSTAIALAANSALAVAEPLKLEPGKPFEIACETQSVVVAGEAKVSRGSLRFRVTPAAEPMGGQAGSWSVIAVEGSHAASFASVHKEACAGGCPVQIGAKSQLMLWAPRLAMPEAMEGNAALTVAALDAEKLTLKASTFRAKDLAALEQGDCRRAE